MKKVVVISLFLLVSLVAYGTTYWVSTTGNDNNNGTSISTPFATVAKGLSMINTGDSLIIRGGTYYQTGFLGINDSGTSFNDMLYVGAYKPDYEAGNVVILDFESVVLPSPTNWSCIGISEQQYIHIYGITVRNLYQRVGPDPPGSYNYPLPQGFGCASVANLKFENCTAHDISGRAFYYDSGAWNEYDGPDAPFESDTTYFINCDAYNLCDSLSLNPGNAADGWKVGNYYRGVVYWIGCRAWNYSDDGFDPHGPGKRVFRNCWAMSGFKYLEFQIEGNGFKCSGWVEDFVLHDSIPRDYVGLEMYNCLAVYCEGSQALGASGLINNLQGDRDMNSIIHNNTFYRNSIGIADYCYQPPNGRTSDYRNNIAIYATHAEFGWDPIYQVAIYNPAVYPQSNNTWIPHPSEPWPGWLTNPAYTVTDDDFVSTDSSQIWLPRKSDGSLPDITFLKLKEDSDLVDAGIDVGLPYNGSGPDIGYAEYGETQASNATNILTFSLHEQTGAATINATNHTVSIEVEYGTDVTSLTPTITLSYGATIYPISGVTRNFTNDVTYLVTAEDKVTTQQWTIMVTVDEEAPPTTTDIIKYRGTIIKHRGTILKIDN